MPTLRLATLIALAVLTGQTPAAAASDSVTLDARLARPVLLAGQKNIAHLRVSLTGRRRPRPGRGRTPTSASPSIGPDRWRARRSNGRARAPCGAGQAARQRLRLGRRLRRRGAGRGPGDPRVGPDGDRVRNRPAATGGRDRAVRRGGQVRGRSAQVRQQNRVNRIVLLSDGMANVGPSSPAALGMLGARPGGGGDLGGDRRPGSRLQRGPDGGAGGAQRRQPRFRSARRGAGALSRPGAGGSHRGGGARRRGQDPLRSRRPAVRVLGRPADIVGQTVTASFGKINGGRQHLFVWRWRSIPRGGRQPVAGRRRGRVPGSARQPGRDVAPADRGSVHGPARPRSRRGRTRHPGGARDPRRRRRDSTGDRASGQGRLRGSAAGA